MKLLLKGRKLRPFYKSEIYFKNMLNKYDYLFPIKGSTKLAGIVADLIGDGHLQVHPKWRIDYTSKSKKELLRFEKEAFKLFKIKGKIRPCKSNRFGKSYNYGINCKPLSIILFLSGVPSGAKVLKKFKVPDWILENKLFFKEFILRLFCCEGGIDYSKNPFIEIKMSKAESLSKDGINFFNILKKYSYSHFGILSNNIFITNSSYKRKDGIKVIEIHFRIKRKKEVYKFIKKIGYPNDKEKREKLLNSLKGNI